VYRRIEKHTREDNSFFKSHLSRTRQALLKYHNFYVMFNRPFVVLILSLLNYLAFQSFDF